MQPAAPVSFNTRLKIDSLFWVVFLAICVLCIVVGFRVPVSKRFTGAADYEAPFALVAHVWTFSAWFVLVGAQALLVSLRKIDWHRSLGWALPPIVLLMTASALKAELFSKRFYAPSYPDQLGLLASTLVEIAAFAAPALAAFMCRRRPAVHKRLIFVATAVLATAAFRRAVDPFLYGAAEPSLLLDLLLQPLGFYLFSLAAAAYDFATRGRVHPALLISGGAIIFANWAAILIGASEWWPDVARWMLGL